MVTYTTRDATLQDYNTAVFTNILNNLGMIATKSLWTLKKQSLNELEYIHPSNHRSLYLRNATKIEISFPLSGVNQNVRVTFDKSEINSACAYLSTLLLKI